MTQSASIRRANITIFMVVVSALLVILLLAATSRAEKKTGPCADDVAKFCKDTQPGEGRMAKCLREHEKDLLPDCKERITAAKQARQEFRKACENDAMHFCKDMKPGGGRIHNCLREHESALTPDCMAMMEKNKELK